jgi:superfamily II DNA helicase RecQ
MQLDYSGRPDTVAMISDLCNNARQDIADMAIKVLKDPQRCVLVLSERRKHLEDIYKLLEPDHGHEMGFYVGGMKASERTSNGTPESSWRRFLRRRKGLTCPD